MDTSMRTQKPCSGGTMELNHIVYRKGSTTVLPILSEVVQSALHMVVGAHKDSACTALWVG
jgi:hypothetical protein